MAGLDHHKDRNESPTSLELDPMHAPPTPPATRIAPTTSLRPPKQGKRKRNISVGMIKRVEGGGVGLVNPMGWYDGERMRDEPSPMEELPPTEMTQAERVEQALERVDRILEGREMDDQAGEMTASPARMNSDE
jgi:hypothetical protein